MKLPLAKIAMQLLPTALWICCTAVYSFTQEEVKIKCPGSKVSLTAETSGSDAYTWKWWGEWKETPREPLHDEEQEPTSQSQLHLPSKYTQVGTHLITVEAFPRQGVRRWHKKWKITVENDCDPKPTITPGTRDPNPARKTPVTRSNPARKTPVTRMVTDRNDKQVEPKSRANVANRPPTAILEGPAVINVTKLAALSAKQSTDPDRNPLTYQWDFGDGKTAAGAEVQHQYDESGPYTVRLVVTDSHGGRNEATLELRAQPPPDINPSDPVVTDGHDRGDKATLQTNEQPPPDINPSDPLGWLVAAILIVITLVVLSGNKSSRRKESEAGVFPIKPRFKPQKDPTGVQEITPSSGLTFDTEISLRPTLDSGEATIVGEGQLVRQEISGLLGWGSTPKG
jgi:hypothetical protein